MPRVRRCVPPAQVLEHLAQLPHAFMAQLTGQGLVLHFFLCLSFGQALPPYLGLRLTLRARFFRPVPQALEHPPQPPHLETLQSIGQGAVLHVVDVLVFSHFFPPCRACCVIVRVFDFVPPPQDLEHLPHAPHFECWQLTGQGFVLHTAFILSAPHFSPPNCGCLVTLRDLDFTPPPHFLEQDSQEFQELSRQCTGQLCVWHFCVLLSAGHALPPYLAGVTTVRVVVCAPPPHVFEHDGQPAHGETTQLTGQCFSLHAFDSETFGQLLPPNLFTVMTVRFRFVVPPPHFLLQGVHLFQLLTWQ